MRHVHEFLETLKIAVFIDAFQFILDTLKGSNKSKISCKLHNQREKMIARGVIQYVYAGIVCAVLIG